LTTRCCPHITASLFLADCCDGTDELSGCKNTCIEKNSAKRDTLKREIDTYQAALDRKSSYASSANGVRENIKQRFAIVDSDIEKAQQELQRLAGVFCMSSMCVCGWVGGWGGWAPGSSGGCDGVLQGRGAAAAGRSGA
jgi:hypothetical protein